MKKLMCFILLGLFAFPCFGKEAGQDSVKQKRSGFIPIPVFFSCNSRSMLHKHHNW